MFLGAKKVRLPTTRVAIQDTLSEELYFPAPHGTDRPVLPAAVLGRSAVLFIFRSIPSFLGAGIRPSSTIVHACAIVTVSGKPVTLLPPYLGMGIIHRLSVTRLEVNRTNGGAVVLNGSATMRWTVRATCTSYLADSNGGAIDVDISELLAAGATIFANHTSKQTGGGMTLLGALGISSGMDDVTLANNSDCIAGGAVFVFATDVGPAFTENINFQTSPLRSAEVCLPRPAGWCSTDSKSRTWQLSAGADSSAMYGAGN